MSKTGSPWNSRVCKILAFWAPLRGFGSSLYGLFTTRQRRECGDFGGSAWACERTVASLKGLGAGGQLGKRELEVLEVAKEAETSSRLLLDRGFLALLRPGKQGPEVTVLVLEPSIQVVTLVIADRRGTLPKTELWWFEHEYLRKNMF